MLANIQALRAGAAFLVVLVHLGGLSAYYQHFPHIRIFWYGSFGIDLFFVISGFIMVYITAERWGRVGAFLAARALRIYPLWWFCLLITMPEIVPSMLGYSEMTSYYVASWFLIPAPTGSGELFPPLTQGWTLYYELLFYLVFALMMFTERRFVTIKISIALLALLGIGYLTTGTLGKFLSKGILLEFAFGVAIGEAFLSGRLRWWHSFVLGAVTVALWQMTSFSDALRIFYFGIPAAALVSGALLLEQANVRAPAAIAFLGDASYSLYLSHTTVIVRLAPWLFWVPLYLSPVVLLAAIYASSVFIYLVFERPVQHLSRRVTFSSARA